MSNKDFSLEGSGVRNLGRANSGVRVWFQIQSLFQVQGVASVEVGSSRMKVPRQDWGLRDLVRLNAYAQEFASRDTISFHCVSWVGV